MLKRYLTIEHFPELRSDAIMLDKTIPDLELSIPPDIYPEIQELVKDIRFAKMSGTSTSKLWKRFARIVSPCIEQEKDRIWFKNKMKIV